ncbi:MAG TPA: sigma-54 dependent transcriptional regulator [Bacteroidota bacterium]|nr:sigma-54 dependent transcriptional regulator [Bacteroidota bacterium]
MANGGIIQVLLIEDEEFDVRRIRNTIAPFSERIQIRDVVSDGHAVLDLLQKNKDVYDVVIMDFQISGGLMGEELIRAIKAVDPSLEIIIVTKMTINVTDFDFAARLLGAGAFWYCTKYPGDIDAFIYQPTDFLLSIFNAFKKKELEKEKTRSHRKLALKVEGLLEEKRILGSSTVIAEVHRQISKCAESSANVLITGPSGTGKEYIALNIHYRGARRFENFVPINCGSIPAELVESELFGYEKGAFTGATARKLGLFEVANGGTLFLDEVAELSLSAQVKLLRVLQEGEIEKIGRTDKIKVDVRIIAASNRELQEEVASGRFREDLFYRLNVVPIAAPPLRERREDIPVFVEHFLRELCAETHRMIPLLEAGAMEALVEYDWPGNVRELKNTLHRLVFNDDGRVTASQVRAALLAKHRVDAGTEEFVVSFGGSAALQSWREMEHAMRERYFRFVRAHSSSDAEAAKKLGLAPPNYHRMCKEMGLK